MRALLSRVRWTLVNLLVHWRNRHHRRAGRRTAGTVLFDVRDNVYERYLLLLAHFFDRMDREVHLRVRAFGTWNTHLLLRFVPRLRLRWSDTTGAPLVITDRPLPGHAGRVLSLSHDYFATSDPAIYRVPMPMVNTVYVQDLEAMVELPAGHPLERMRPIKLFFAGDFGGVAYAPVEVRTVFGMMDRPAMREVIRARFPDRIFKASRPEDLARVDRPLCIIDRYNDLNVPPRELRWILGHSDFTIAFPGVVMPWTHGVIEAMSLGVVPIIQYPHLFDPPLRDGRECIAFTDPDGLVSGISRALAMDAAAVARMKEAALRYYRAHLSPGAVVRRITDDPRITGIRLLAEHHSVRLLQRRMAADPTVHPH